jgi:quercetin dioxygenase-like cupin family protein
MTNLKNALLAITSAALPLIALAQDQATRDAGGPGGRGGQLGSRKTYLDFQKEIVEDGGRSPGGFVRDGETAANITRAPGAPTPPPSQLGHFHDGTSEFWFIMEGDDEFQIEGMPFIRATQGDIVYALAGRWHRSGHAGEQMDTRISIHPIGAAANALPPNGGGGD